MSRLGGNNNMAGIKNGVKENVMKRFNVWRKRAVKKHNALDFFDGEEKEIGAGDAGLDNGLRGLLGVNTERSFIFTIYYPEWNYDVIFK